MKFVLAILMALALGVSGCAKAAPPTDPSVLSQGQRVRLIRFIAKPKFASDKAYVGYMSEDVVADPEAALNDLATRWLERGTSDRASVLDDAVHTLQPFALADTEDRERAYLCVKRLLADLGIVSPDGRLERALAPVDPENGHP